ncbi:hypothetical protein TrVE_jg8567 [Triparma verrucosa]|uniref:Uncharacterized protein n=1 Tax=Triparma verrucosa TaxID=1606542 RepID=A0A9W7FGF3_9STRA|nr:hypothetical protein TrVE_jg8567 [Triparma verrucosa]
MDQSQPAAALANSGTLTGDREYSRVSASSDPPPPYSLLSCESSSETNHSCLHFLSQGTYIPCKPLLKNLNNLTIVSNNDSNNNDETYTLLVEQGSLQQDNKELDNKDKDLIPFKRLHLHAKKHKNIIKNETQNPHVHYCSIYGQIHEINKYNGILTHIHSEVVVCTYPKFDTLTFISNVNDKTTWATYAKEGGTLIVYEDLVPIHTLQSTTPPVITSSTSLTYTPHDSLTQTLHLPDPSTLYIYISTTLPLLTLPSHSPHPPPSYTHSLKIPHLTSPLPPPSPTNSYAVLTSTHGLLMLTYPTPTPLKTFNTSLPQTRSISSQTASSSSTHIFTCYLYNSTPTLSIYPFSSKSVNRLSCSISSPTIPSIGSISSSSKGCCILTPTNSFLIYNLKEDITVHNITEKINNTLEKRGIHKVTEKFLKGGSIDYDGFWNVEVSSVNGRGCLMLPQVIFKEGRGIKQLIVEAGRREYYAMNCMSQIELQSRLLTSKISEGHLEQYTECNAEEVFEVMHEVWGVGRGAREVCVKWGEKCLGEGWEEFLIGFYRSLEPKEVERFVKEEGGRRAEDLSSECARRGNARGASLGLVMFKDRGNALRKGKVLVRHCLESMGGGWWGGEVEGVEEAQVFRELIGFLKRWEGEEEGEEEEEEEGGKGGVGSFVGYLWGGETPSSVPKNAKKNNNKKRVDDVVLEFFDELRREGKDELRKELAGRVKILMEGEGSEKLTKGIQRIIDEKPFR